MLFAFLFDVYTAVVLVFSFVISCMFCSVDVSVMFYWVDCYLFYWVDVVINGWF